MRPTQEDMCPDSPRREGICILCGTPIPRRRGEGAVFCCAGCEKVHDVLGRLDDDAKPAYLETARRLGLIPDSGADSAPPGAVSRPEQEAPASKEDAVGCRRERLEMKGLVCPSCGWVAEQVLSATDGVLAARVDYFSATCDVRYDMTRVSRDDLHGLLVPLGYGLEPLSDQGSDAISRKDTLRFLVVAILAMNIMSLSFVRYFHGLGVLETLPRFVSWLEGALTLPVLYIGWLPILRRAAASLRHRRMTMDLLITIGVGAAAILSAVSLFTGREDMYFETCAGLVTISLLSRMIESRLREKAFSFLAPLMRMRVVNARRLDANGDEEYIDVGEIRPGDDLVFAKGETIPFDGTVASDRALVSEAVLTGEPAPIAKVQGDAVAAGSEVAEGRLTLTVSRRFEETLLAQIAESIGETLAKQEQRLRQSDRIASFFIPAVVAVAIGAWVARGISHGLAFALTPEGWFPSISVLAVACPCAFSLAGISAVTAVIGALLKKGFLVKALERLPSLAKVNHVIFDKTGTITRGIMAVERLVWRGAPDLRLLKNLIETEVSSGHPAAEAIRAHLAGEVLPAGEPPPVDIRDIHGQGRAAEIGSRTLFVGSASLFDGPFTPDGVLPSHTVVWFGFDGRAEGCFLLTDEVRPGAGEAIADLTARGISTELVSGDRAQVTALVAATVGIGAAAGGASISDKVDIVKARRAAGKTVAFVGDGTNDALAMTEADVSIALAKSTDEALAASDIVAVHGDIENLREVFVVGRRLAGVVSQNYLWAFGFNTLFIPVAAAGELIPLAAMLLMLLSSIAVLLNALRLR